MPASAHTYAVSVRSLYRTLLREAGRFFDKHTSAYLQSQIHREFRHEVTLVQARKRLDALRCANANDAKTCYEMMRSAWGREGEVRDELMRPIRDHGGLPLQKLIETQFLPQHREFRPVENVAVNPLKLEKARREHRLKLLSDLLPPIPYAWRAQMESLAADGGPDAGSLHPRLRHLRSGLYRKLLDDTPVFMAVSDADNSTKGEERPGGSDAASPAIRSGSRQLAAAAPRPRTGEREAAAKITVNVNFMSNFSKEGSFFPPDVAPFTPGRPQGKPLPPGEAILQEALAMGLQLTVGRSSLSVAAIATKGKPQIGPVHLWGFDLEGEEGNAVRSRRRKKHSTLKKRLRRGKFTQVRGLPLAERALL